MSTTLTATFPDLAFTPDTAGASFHGTPTMPVSALAWSLADAADVPEADAHAPVVAHPAAAAPTSARPPISRVAIVGMLFGGVTVVAALGAIVARISLDYFIVDCAETRDGRLLVFEADNTAIVHDMDPPEVFPYKSPQMRRIFDAFAAMIERRSRKNQEWAA